MLQFSYRAAQHCSRLWTMVNRPGVLKHMTGVATWKNYFILGLRLHENVEQVCISVNVSWRNVHPLRDVTPLVKFASLNIYRELLSGDINCPFQSEIWSSKKLNYYVFISSFSTWHPCRLTTVTCMCTKFRSLSNSRTVVLGVFPKTWFPAICTYSRLKGTSGFCVNTKSTL